MAYKEIGEIGKKVGKKCVQRDVISFTVIVSEMKDGNEYDRRGLSTIIHIV